MKTKICENCRYCECVYTRLWYSYQRINRFYCTAHERLTELEQSCEKWQSKQKARYDLSMERLDRAEEDIKEILNLLNET